MSMVSSDGPSSSLLVLVIFVLGSFSTLVCLEAYHFQRDFQRTDFQFHRVFFFSFAVSVPLISVQFFHYFFSSICFGFDFVFFHKVNGWIIEINVIWVAYSFRVRLSMMFFEIHQELFFAPVRLLSKDNRNRLLLMCQPWEMCLK